MKIIKSLKSKDGITTKYLQEAKDDHIIETAFYGLDEHIICLSSQIGCPMGCVFCAATKPADDSRPSQPLIRNLNTEEIVQQAKNVLNLLDPNVLSSKRVLLSFMGLGEPFLNYQNVVQGTEKLTREYPNSRVTISTIGASPEKMKKIAREKLSIIIKLHLSLHAPNDKLRRKILPRAGKIKPSLEALKYFSLTKNVKAKVNYHPIKNLNDSKKHALQLAKLLEPYPFIVKLSMFNSYNGLEPSTMGKFKLFEDTLNAHGIETCRFVSVPGLDIKAGCGQFRRHYYAA